MEVARRRCEGMTVISEPTEVMKPSSHAKGMERRQPHQRQNGSATNPTWPSNCLRAPIGRVLAGIIAKHASPIEDATDSGGEASMNFESRNPATGELLGVYREHDKAQTDARANHKIKETRFRELPLQKG